MDNLIFNVTDEFIGERIDKYLSMQIQGKSRSFIQGLITDKKIDINGCEVKSNYKLRKNDIINVILPEPIELNVTAEKIDINIIYEDEDVVVVNKEKGMVVHPAPGNYKGTLVNALLYHCGDLSGINGVIRPGIVHRIDKDTSGILVIAKNDAAHNFLAEQFKDHSIRREYYALVEGRFNKKEGTIDKPLGRHKKERIKMAIVDDGKRAVTHYEVLEEYNKGVTLVKCTLETGRTHQIRVHLSEIGYPVVGDTVYSNGKNEWGIKGQCLHAKSLKFKHPITGKEMFIEAPLPKYFENILKDVQ